MKTFASVILLLLAIDCGAQRFEANQLMHARVKHAYQSKEKKMLDLLQSKGIAKDQFQLYFRAFKKEMKFEVWAKNRKDRDYQLLVVYPFCQTSGTLGPKRREGDMQIPEGFYMTDRFNPESNFYLALEVNYPNQADRKLSDKQSPGGAIYIHGNCVTIGCIPLGDDKIMELYVLAVKARSFGQTNIPVHLFPFYMETKQMSEMLKKHQNDAKLCDFWKELKIGYDFFEKNKQIPLMNVDANGHYELAR